jgi:hypothetical protein
VPIQTHDFDGLVFPLPAGEKAWLIVVEISPQNLSSNDNQEKHADRHVRAMEARDHEEGRAKLSRAHRVAPGTDSFFHDQLGPLKGLHPDECGAKCRGRQHQETGFDALAPIAEVDGHGHRPAAADQDEGHDGDQDEGEFYAPDRQGEDLTGVGPRHRRGRSHRHVRDQKNGEDEGIADEEDPNHCLAPGDILKRPLVRGIVGNDALHAFRRREGFFCICQRRWCHVLFAFIT